MTNQDNLPLFDALPAPSVRSSVAPSPISDDQVEAIRAAFSSAGKNSMEERRQFIEGCLMRSIENIRALTASEARRVVKSLSRPVAKSTGGSAWDDREEDTWIDKL